MNDKDRILCELSKDLQDVKRLLFYMCEAERLGLKDSKEYKQVVYKLTRLFNYN